MQLTLKKRTLRLREVRILFTDVVRVNWFVACVNWDIDDACNLILFEVVMTKLLVNDIR